MKKTGEETITPIKNMKIIQRNDFQNFTLDSVLLSDFVKINRKTKKFLILELDAELSLYFWHNAQRHKLQVLNCKKQWRKLLKKMLKIINLRIKSK